MSNADRSAYTSKLDILEKGIVRALPIPIYPNRIKACLLNRVNCINMTRVLVCFIGYRHIDLIMKYEC